MHPELNELMAAAAHAEIAVEKAPADLSADAKAELVGVAGDTKTALGQYMQAMFEAYKAGV